jgi:RHS repeat-associated protein
VNKTDTYGYDSAGNTTSRNLNGVPQNLTYDPEGHLQKVTQGATTLENNLYDAEGNRLIRREPSTGRTTLFWGTHTELTLNTSNGAITGTRYYDYAEHTIAVRTGIGEADVTTLVPDHHGTASYAVANTTGLLSARRLDPFGNPRGAPPASWPGQRGYVNGTPDNPVGLTHLGARDYDPALGRFLSVDPLVDISQPETLNAYAYSNNSPVIQSDPDGTRPMDAGSGGELPVKALKTWAKTNTKAVAHRSAPPTAEERQRQHIIGTRNGKRMHGARNNGSFDFSVNFITDEMLNNSTGDTAIKIRLWFMDDQVECMLGWPTCQLTHLLDDLGPGSNSLRYDAALAAWGMKVRTGGDWDHKPRLQRIFGHEGENFYMRVPDTNKAVSFDLWSNIHYGYVGTELGISEDVLQTGARLGNTIPGLKAFAGSNDRFDEVAIQIGIDLRHQYSTQDLTADAVRSTVLSRLPELEAARGRHVQTFDPGNPRMEP